MNGFPLWLLYRCRRFGFGYQAGNALSYELRPVAVHLSLVYKIGQFIMEGVVQPGQLFRVPMVRPQCLMWGHALEGLPNIVSGYMIELCAILWYVVFPLLPHFVPLASGGFKALFSVASGLLSIMVQISRIGDRLGPFYPGVH